MWLLHCKHSRYWGMVLLLLQVDTPADISTLATSRTSIKLSYVSNSSGYVLGARLVRQQSIERVKQMLGRESSLIAAVAEVKKKVGVHFVYHCFLCDLHCRVTEAVIQLMRCSFTDTVAATAAHKPCVVAACLCVMHVVLLTVL